jgi:hypothetical protein
MSRFVCALYFNVYVLLQILAVFVVFMCFCFLGVTYYLGLLRQLIHYFDLTEKDQRPLEVCVIYTICSHIL